MSDCSTRQSKQHRTCGTCEELYMAPRCNRFGHVMLDENDEPDDDGTTFADCCSLWTPRTEPTLEQRCQLLEQLAQEMHRCLAIHAYDWTQVSEENADYFAAKLEALGVSVDD